MSRPVNTKLKNDILEFLKREWIVAGQKPISPSYQRIAEAVGVPQDRPEKIMRMINMLERGGHIQIIERGRGCVPNTYVFQKDNIKEVLTFERLQEFDPDKIVGELNNSIKTILMHYTKATDEYQQLKSENEYLKDKIGQLEFFASQDGGKEIFISQKQINLRSLIEQIRREKAKVSDTRDE
jgi:ssDNA-binding replication factor A large subunit